MDPHDSNAVLRRSRQTVHDCWSAKHREEKQNPASARKQMQEDSSGEEADEKRNYDAKAGMGKKICGV